MNSQAGLSNGSVLDAEHAPSGGIQVENVGAFLRRLAHDIRNDLSAIQLLVAFLQEGEGADARSEVGGQVNEALRHGSRRMARVARAFEVPSVERIDYPLELFFEDFKGRALAARPELSERVVWRLKGGQETASLDPALAMEALDELLENALAFSPLDSSIYVTAVGGGTGVEWCFSQSTQSIPQAYDLWGRSPLVGSRKGGYGLGLFRARRIIEAHGGRLGFAYSAETCALSADVFFPGGRL